MSILLSSGNGRENSCGLLYDTYLRMASNAGVAEWHTQRT
jgi:hypothetical protein